MTILPRTIYRLSAITIKLVMTLFSELEKQKYNLYGNKKTPNSQKNLDKEKLSKRN